jgi:hypothetical protein
VSVRHRSSLCELLQRNPWRARFRIGFALCAVEQTRRPVERIVSKNDDLLEGTQ